MFCFALTAVELVTEEHLREFTDQHLVLTLDESFSADEFIDVYTGVRKDLENPQSLPKLGSRASKADRLYAFVGGLLPVHKSAGEVLLWLVKKKHVKLRNLETFKVKYKGKSAECVAKRIITQYRPSEEKLQRLGLKKPRFGRTGDPSHDVSPGFREVDQANAAPSENCSGAPSSPRGTEPSNHNEPNDSCPRGEESAEINMGVTDDGIAQQTGAKVSCHSILSHAVKSNINVKL